MILDGLPRSAGAVTLEPSVVYTLHREDFLRPLPPFPTSPKVLSLSSATVCSN